MGKDHMGLGIGDKLLDAIEHQSASLRRTMDDIILGILARVSHHEQSEPFRLSDNADVAIIIDEGTRIIGMNLDALKAVILQITQLILDVLVIGVDTAEGDELIVGIVDVLGEFCDRVELTRSGVDGEDHAFVDPRFFHTVKDPVDRAVGMGDDVGRTLQRL